MVFLRLADPLHADPAYHRDGARVGWPDDGDDLFQALLKCAPCQRCAGLGGIAVAPRILVQLPADLILIVGRQRKQGGPADHSPVLAKLDRPPAARCQHPLVLGHPLLQDHAHRGLIADLVHRRSEPPRHIGIAIGAQRGPRVIAGPLAEDQAFSYQLLGH